MQPDSVRRRQSRVRFQDEASVLDRLEAASPLTINSYDTAPDEFAPFVPPGLPTAIDNALPLPSHWTCSPVAVHDPLHHAHASPVLRSPAQPSPRITHLDERAMGIPSHSQAELVWHQEPPPPRGARCGVVPRRPPLVQAREGSRRAVRQLEDDDMYTNPFRRREDLENSPISSPTARWSHLPMRLEGSPVQPESPSPFAHFDVPEHSAGDQAFSATHSTTIASVPPLSVTRRATPSAKQAGSPARPSARRVFSDDILSIENVEVRHAASILGRADGDGRQSALSNLVSLYGVRGRPLALTRGHMWGLERENTTRSTTSSMTRMQRDGSDHGELIDDYDPRVTGREPNRLDDEKRAKDTLYGLDDKKGTSLSCVENSTGALASRQTFLLRLARALMRYGMPSHRIESQLVAAARILEVDAQFVHLPSIVIASFGDPDSKASETHFVKTGQGLTLGKLHEVHVIYRQVMHHEIGAEEGTDQLDRLLTAPPIFGLGVRCLIAFLLTALICPLAFGGSVVDMLISGTGGGVLCWLQLSVAKNNALYANVFEISIAIGMSFIARALSSIQSQIFCYTAISSSGVVLILPGYLVLCSSLELASKNIVCGSVRMIYAIIYSLFLGFGLTIGSDLYFLLDSGARTSRSAAVVAASDPALLHGSFTPDDPALKAFTGAFTFNNGTEVSLPDIFEGCFRDPNWPWYLRSFPPWTLFLLVPTFSLISSLGNLQPLKSKHMPVMVFISCCSFAANTAANHYIFNRQALPTHGSFPDVYFASRSDVVSALGAFVVGVLGNLYSRICGGTAFTSMVTGVLFLVPSGIAAAGGLAQNYAGTNGDQYSNGLQIGLRMVQVAIGITVGLFGSGLLVYSFGRRKNGATFAF